jgi:S1-C subfamily serine protease
LLLGTLKASSPESFEDVLASSAVVISRTEQRSQGTAFFVAPNVLVTAAHVVGNEGSRVLLQINDDVEQIAAAYVTYRDETNDIAILKSPRSFDNPRVMRAQIGPTTGETVYAIGAPIDGLVITKGAVTEVASNTVFTSTIGAPGMSGGPLVNVQGELIGLVVSVNSRNQILAVPSPLVAAAIEVGSARSLPALPLQISRGGAGAPWPLLLLGALVALMLMLLVLQKKRARSRKQPIVIKLEEA